MSNFSEPPQNAYVNPQVVEKQGMSGAAKVLLILGCIFLLSIGLCCGGGIFLLPSAGTYVEKYMEDATTEDPAIIAQRKSEILDIDLPESFEPQTSLDMAVPVIGRSLMTFVAYSGPTSADSIVLVGVGDVFGASQQDIEKEVQKAMREQDFGQDESGVQWEITEKEFTIGGRTTTFVYRTAKDQEDAPKWEEIVQEEDAPEQENVVQVEREDAVQESDGTSTRFHVTGTVQGNRGLVFVFINADSETLSEEEIDQIIESIE